MVSSNFNPALRVEDKLSEVKAKVIDRQARAEISMLAGKRLIVTGCAIAILGIVLYCYFSFSEAFQVGAQARQSLVLTGAGVLVWLWGAVKYFLGAIDSTDPGELL